MMEVYVRMDDNFENIIAYATEEVNGTYIKAVQEDPVIDISKLFGYKLQVDGGVQKLVFDEEKYNKIAAEKKKEQDIKDGNALLEQLATKSVLDNATDTEAYAMRYLYDPWEKDKDYKTGDRKRYGDNLYKCRQDHTSQEQYTPDLVPALWDIVGDDARGSKDNPVIVPEEVSSMEYVKGKYYLEGDTLYLMNRQGMENGETVSLAYKPSQLVGQYFEIVEA